MGVKDTEEYNQLFPEASGVFTREYVKELLKKFSYQYVKELLRGALRRSKEEHEEHERQIAEERERQIALSEDKNEKLSENGE